MNGVTLIRGARHWKSGEVVDLAFAGGVVVEKPRTPERMIEARGAVLAPGLVDVHVHLREPGQTAKETIASGARAAAAGGFTGVLCMPNTVPALDDAAWIEWVVARGRAAGSCRIYPIGAVTVGQKGERLTDFSALAAAGAVALSDDGRPILTAAMMRRALSDSRRVGLPVIAHEEDLSLRGDGHMNEGPVAARLGLHGIPSAAESVMVRRDVDLADLTRGHLHLAHLSCRASLDALRDAKRRGLAVTGESCPHYWTLTDEAVGDYDTNAKMNPPLRSAEDRDAVVEAIADGTLDCLATDHAPHTREEKLQPFDRAPFGIVGLETALALTITFLVEPGRVTLARALELWTEAPRRLFGLPEVTLAPGSPADLVLLDPSARWRIEPERFHSKGRNTPFAGWEVRGRTLLTVCGGAVTHAAEEMGIDVEVGTSVAVHSEEAPALIEQTTMSTPPAPGIASDPSGRAGSR